MTEIKQNIGDQLCSEGLFLPFWHPLLPVMLILIQLESVEKNSRDAGKAAPFNLNWSMDQFARGQRSGV